MDIKLMPEKYKKGEIKEGPESKQKSSGFFAIFKKEKIWFRSSLGLLILVVLICLGLWGYKINLTDRNETAEERIEELQNQRNIELEEKLAEIKQASEKTQELLSQRVYSSRLFEAIEQMALSKVQFSNLNVNLEKGTMILKVEADSYNTLAKQLKVFKDDQRIKEAELSNVNLNRTGRVVSDFNLELDTGFLRGPQ